MKKRIPKTSNGIGEKFFNPSALRSADVGVCGPVLAQYARMSSMAPTMAMFKPATATKINTALNGTMAAILSVPIITPNAPGNRARPIQLTRPQTSGVLPQCVRSRGNQMPSAEYTPAPMQMTPMIIL